MARIIIGLIVIGAIVAAGWYWFGSSDGNSLSGEITIETVAIEKRDLSRSVSSTGAIAPLVLVEVGSQLSGQVLEINKDFNDQVSEGELIARIDPQTFATRVREAEASLQVSQAQVSVSEANLVRARAELREADRAFERAEELLERGTYSEAQFDTALTRRDSTQAALTVAEANLRNSRATAQQRDANLESARVDLERTYIRSPIDGVVIDRQIDVGQTVAASFNAPVLFLIAQDLSRIQIEAQVDEADIGDIQVDQSVSFDVDAYPDRDFTGEVKQVRLAATTEQNVVTYTVVIEANNPGQRLLPGMTANVNIITGEVADALSLPNAALRFEPRGTAETLIDASQSEGQSGGQRRGGSGNPMSAMMDRLSEQLEMSDEQRDQAETALGEAFAQLRAQAQAGGGQGGRPDIQGMIQRALRDILTPEQMELLAELQSEQGGRRRDGNVRRATVWIETENGRLAQRQVSIGLSDGQFTQIISDNFQTGDVVVTRVREAD